MEAKSYQQMRKEFNEAYHKAIVPKVQKFEHERRKTRIIATIVSTILAIVCTFFVFLAFISSSESEAQKSNTKLAALFGLGAWFSWYNFKKSFENKIKKNIMPIVCSCFGNLKWSEGFYKQGHSFKDSKVVPAFSSETYDDIFTGSYKNVSIDIVESEFEAGSGKNRRTVFKGVVVKLGMNKNFNSHTVIKPDSALHLSPDRKLERTTLEDVVFEKKYDVFTNDPVDARYLITTSFMDRLNNIKTVFNADSISCSFYKDKLIIALSTHKDLFSLCSLIKPVDDPKQFFTMYEEIVSIIKLIDHFKLDQKIGL